MWVFLKCRLGRWVKRCQTRGECDVDPSIFVVSFVFNESIFLKCWLQRWGSDTTNSIISLVGLFCIPLFIHTHACRSSVGLFLMPRLMYTGLFCKPLVIYTGLLCLPVLIYTGLFSKPLLIHTGLFCMPLWNYPGLFCKPLLIYTDLFCKPLFIYAGLFCMHLLVYSGLFCMPLLVYTSLFCMPLLIYTSLLWHFCGASGCLFPRQKRNWRPRLMPKRCYRRQGGRKLEN